MSRLTSLPWSDRGLLVALTLTVAMYVLTVLIGGVPGEYLPQPTVAAIVLGVSFARWRSGLGWSMAIVGMLSIATLLFFVAEGRLYPAGVSSIDQPGGDPSRIGEFRPPFFLHMVATLLAALMATILASRIIERRWVPVVGLVVMIALWVVGAATLLTGDWISYAALVTVPVPPWMLGWPVYGLLVLAGAWWAMAAAMRVHRQAELVHGPDRLPVIRNALLGELLPAFADAQRSAATAERARLATELHASVLPTIRSATEIADRLGAVSPDLGARLAELEVEVRRMADGERNVLLEEFGLVGAIEDLVEGVQHRHGVPIGLQVHGDVDLGRPPRPVEQAGFDICRSALDNAVRHADPAGILVIVGTSRTSVALDVIDDGRGLQPDAIRTARQAGRRGVTEMQQAARSVSGRLSFEQTTGGGTRVSFRWGSARGSDPSSGSSDPGARGSGAGALT